MVGQEPFGSFLAFEKGTRRQGEIVTLIGANGAGKSTLLMTLCGSPQAHSGSIRYMGEELVGQDSSHIMRKSIAVVPEGRRVFARLTVEENLAMGGFFTDKGDCLLYTSPSPRDS